MTKIKTIDNVKIRWTNLLFSKAKTTRTSGSEREDEGKRCKGKRESDRRRPNVHVLIESWKGMKVGSGGNVGGGAEKMSHAIGVISLEEERIEGQTE